MLLIGPRLDRPSAIGDEGRPRATSLTVAAFVVAGLFAAAEAAVGMTGLLPGVGLVVGVAVAGASLLGRDRIGTLLLGHLLFLPFASALLGLLVLSFGTPYGVLVTGLAVATLGIAGTWADVLEREHVQTVATGTLVSYVSMLFNVVAFAFVASVGWLLLVLIRDFLGGVGPSASVVGFSLLLVGFALSLRVALAALPVVQLAPVSRRRAVAERVARWARATTLGAVACVFGTVVLAVCWAAGYLALLYAAVPGTATLFGLFSSPFVAGPVVAVGVLCLVAAGGAWLARRLTRQFDPSSARRVAAIVAGGLFVLFMVPFLAAGLALPGILGFGVALQLALVGPPVVLLVAGAGLAAGALGILPDRAGGPALASTGLVVATVGAGLGGLPSSLVFACAAAALVVWDVSSFGLGVTAELGHLPETRRLELFHGVLGVGLGVVAVLAAMGLDRLRTLSGSTGGVMPAALTAVVGVLVLLALLRG